MPKRCTRVCPRKGAHGLGDADFDAEFLAYGERDPDQAVSAIGRGLTLCDALDG
jgi:hypothetical protein